MAAGAVGAIQVRNLHETELAFRRISKDLDNELKGELRVVAEPVRADSETFARSRISTIGRPWSQFRVGITAKTVVYVAPKRRGLKAGPMKRPNLAVRLMDEAMQPALEKNQGNIQRRLDVMLDVLAAENGF